MTSGLWRKDYARSVLGANTNYQIVVKRALPDLSLRDSTGTNGVFQQISVDCNVLLSFFNPRGIAINYNPKSPLFGRVYIGN